MSNVATAITMLVNLTNAAVELTANAQKIGSLVQKAQTEGRDKFTEEEWVQIRALDTEARGHLEAAIARNAAA